MLFLRHSGSMHYRTKRVTCVTIWDRFCAPLYLPHKLKRTGNIYIVAFFPVFMSLLLMKLISVWQPTVSQWKQLSNFSNSFSLHCTWNTESDFSLKSGFYMPIVDMTHNRGQFSCLLLWDTNSNNPLLLLTELVVWQLITLWLWKNPNSYSCQQIEVFRKQFLALWVM